MTTVSGEALNGKPIDNDKKKRTSIPYGRRGCTAVATAIEAPSWYNNKETMISSPCLNR
jgi:hypothetical protein